MTLAVDETAGRVDVTVSDNGPGIPETERAVFRAGSETDLRHGSGLGLWLAYWAVTSVGGDLSFADRDPRGSRVTLSYRHPDREDRVS